MKLFKKEPDMKCWSCEQLISHKKVNWKPRKVGWKGGNPLGTAILTDLARKIEKTMGNKEAIASPNEVFGLHEYEYHGQCPKCNATLAGFWFGLDSLSKNKNIVKENQTDLMPAIKKWGGYSPESISDSELLKVIGIKAQNIPSWFMKTSRWVVNGDTSQQEFVTAIKYLHRIGIIN